MMKISSNNNQAQFPHASTKELQFLGEIVGDSSAPGITLLVLIRNLHKATQPYYLHLDFRRSFDDTSHLCFDADHASMLTTSGTGPGPDAKRAIATNQSISLHH